MLVAGVVIIALASVAVMGVIPRQASIGTATIERILRHAIAEASSGSEASQNAKLAASIQPIITNNSQLQIGVSMINLKTGTALNLGNTQPFTAASTTKILTAAAFLHSVEQGQNNLNETLGAYTAAYQLKEMINDSDNDAWAALNNQIGYPQLGAYAQSIGLSSFDVNANTITAANEALLLQKLYNGQLLNQSDTSLVLSYMQNTNDESLIPAALPAGATVHHKYGQLNGDLHDAAIISYDGQSVVFVIYTNAPNGGAYTQQVGVIHQITQALTANLAQR
jgi:beta-lactamase class A